MQFSLTQILKRESLLVQTLTQIAIVLKNINEQIMFFVW